jgi:hypothetical protein
LLFWSPPAGVFLRIRVIGGWGWVLLNKGSGGPFLFVSFRKFSPESFFWIFQEPAPGYSQHSLVMQLRALINWHIGEDPLAPHAQSSRHLQCFEISSSEGVLRLLEIQPLKIRGHIIVRSIPLFSYSRIFLLPGQNRLTGPLTKHLTVHLTVFDVLH